MQLGARKLRLFFVLAGPAMAACGTASVSSDAAVGSAAHHDVSPPLLLMPPAPRQGPVEHEVKAIPRSFNRNPRHLDAAVQSAPVQIAAPALTRSFDGVGSGFSGPSGTFTVNAAPPDTNGDVGPNHYVQIVNTDYAVFSKSETVLYGPVPVNTLWSGFGGLCQATNDGDPLAVYDPIADRWVISQFAVTGANGTSTPYLQCVAVSTTPDPTGSYYRYSFPYSAFPDYPKMGVWPDAYYFTFNMFNGGTTFAGSRLCAYDRAKMLAGAAATQQCFQTSTTYGGVLPADFDGTNLPPAGSPEYLVALGATTSDLAYWLFHVDWAAPANSTLTGPVSLPVTAYAEACAGGACIPQSGTSQKLDSLADRIMYRLAYRNLGAHESLVVNHSVTAGSSTGVRWYELRADAAHDLSVFQQGTYAPDANYRWMGSSAMDQAGNIALGFSVSSSATHPAIHYTARLAGDAAGTMTQGEGSLLDGTGSQLANLDRWGDYSMLGVDPADDCTFWFTSEYLTANGTFNWHTRIGSFKLAGCGLPPPANDFSISANPAAVSVTQGGSTSSAISTTVTAGTPESVTFSASGLPAGATAAFAPVSVIAGASSTMTLTTSSTTPAGTYAITVTGTAPSVAHATTVTLTVNAPVVPDFSLSISPTSRTVRRGASTTYTLTVTPQNGFAGAVTLSASGLPANSTATFSPNPAASTSTMTVTTAKATPRGTYSLTVRGASGALTHAVTASLAVQ